MKKFLTTTILILSMLLLFLSGCQQQEKIENNTINRQPTTLYVGHSPNSDYKTIQEALNNSIDGDRIIIEEGTYNEFLTINTSICLSGEDKNTTFIQPIIQEKNSQVNIISIHAARCAIENVSITVSIDSSFVRGLYVNSSNNTIENNNIYGIFEGIFLSGFSANNTISMNKIMDNRYGIQAHASKNNTITNNIFSSNNLYGTYLVDDGDYNSISNNIFSRNNYGIRIMGSKYNKVFENCILDNNQGVYCCCGAYYNEFYSNVFKNNLLADAQEDSDLVNFWYNYNTSVGNYWDKYTGSDVNRDGFGDTPFEIPDANQTDSYPLIDPPSHLLCE